MFLKTIKIFFLLLFSFLSIFPLSYFFGFLYELLITHPVGGSFWGLNGSIVAGFFMAIFYLSSFFIFLIFKKILVKITLLFLLTIFIFYYFWGIDIIDIIILISASWLGALLGFSSQAIKNKYLINK